MKIALKRDQQNDTPTPDGGLGYESRVRFRDPLSLYMRYASTRKTRGTMQNWVNIMRLYDRTPYKDGDQTCASFGQFRFKCDKAMTTYVDYATERETWATIKTDIGEDGVDVEYSDHIQAAFHKYCISRWSTGATDIMLSVRDMILFSKGAFVFECETGCYPISLGIDNFWPDKAASMHAKSFDTLFIERRYTAVELFQKVEEEGGNWNRKAVLDLLKSRSTIKNIDTESLYRRFCDGNVPSDDQDYSFDLVICYVKEYRKDENGNQISKYVIPQTGLLPKKNDEIDGDALNKSGFLYERRSAHKCISEVCCPVGHTVTRSFYEDPSFAQQMYTQGKLHDQVSNRIWQAIEDNMRVFWKTANPESLRKMVRATSRFGNWQVVDQNVELVQSRVVAPVVEAANVLRSHMVDTDSGLGQYTISETDRGGSTPKTATQTTADVFESGRISSAQLKVFNEYMKALMAEMYRRFTTEMTEADEGYEDFLKFKRYLSRKQVPHEAWNPDNVQVDSVLNLGAGSPAAKLQMGSVIMDTLSQPAASPGELRAKRLMIAAVAGVSSVDAYLPKETETRIPEDSLIGLENDALSSSQANPENIPVEQNQLHLRHVPAHIRDAAISLQRAEAMLANISQFPDDEHGSLLRIIGDISIGVDNKLAHARAHLTFVGKSRNQKIISQLTAFSRAIQEVNSRQDDLERQLNRISEERMRKANENAPEDPKIAHAQAMYQLKETHEAQMMAMEFQKAQMKGQQLRDNSEENHQLRNRVAVAGAQTKAQIEVEKARAQVQTSRIKSNGSKKSTEKK